jgi:cytochrome b561
LIYGLVFPAEIEDLSDPAALALEVRFALALGCIFLIRLIWVEFIGDGSRLPPGAPRWERVLSRMVHYGIYAMVLAVVLSGLAIAAPTLFGVNVTFLASSSASQGFLLDLHEAFATTLLLLIVAHLFGSIWHWMVRRDGVWESMLRGSARRELP